MSASRMNIVLLVVIGAMALAVAALVVERGDGPAHRLPAAFAAQAPGSCLMATIGNTNARGPYILWVYDTDKQRLIAYEMDGNRLTLMYVRDAKFENDPKLQGYVAPGHAMSPPVK